MYIHHMYVDNFGGIAFMRSMMHVYGCPVEKPWLNMNGAALDRVTV